MNNQKYSVYILAAGTGNRLGKLGKKIPKSLLQFENHYLIDILLKYLKNNDLTKINIVLGYKKKKIINHLKKKKDFKFNFIKIRNYKVNGSSYSWYLIKKNFFKEKKPSIIMHADIFFEEIILKKILKSKHKNIISGIRNKSLSNDKKWGIQSNNNDEIISLDNKRYSKGNYFTEVACINKFSKNGLNKILKFMKDYFKTNHKRNTWEIILDRFIKKKDMKIYTVKIFNKYWFNINTKSEYIKASKFYRESNS